MTTAVATFRAASSVLRAERTARSTAVADWLDSAADELLERHDAWARAYEPPGVADLIAANTAALYGHPLAVARAALGEAV